MFGTTGKSIAAGAVAVIMLIVSLIAQHGHVTTAEWVQLCIAVTSAITVYMAPRTSHYPAVKTILYAVMVVLNGAASLLVGDHMHLTAGEWISLAIAALGTLAVAKAPATLHTTGPTTVTDGP